MMIVWMIFIMANLLVIRSSFIFVIVQGNSMTPEIMPGDRIIIFRAWPKNRIYRGQIVLIEDTFSQTIIDSHPKHLRKYVKKVVGIPGDTVTLTFEGTGSSIWMKEHDSITTQKHTWNIPIHHIFVCGNHHNSYDSTSWGPIPLKCIRGVVLFVFHKKTTDIPLSKKPLGEVKQ